MLELTREMGAVDRDLEAKQGVACGLVTVNEEDVDNARADRSFVELKTD